MGSRKSQRRAATRKAQSSTKTVYSHDVDLIAREGPATLSPAQMMTCPLLGNISDSAEQWTYEESTWEISSIIKARYRRNDELKRTELKYLVEWKGEKQPTWESYTSLQGVEWFRIWACAHPTLAMHSTEIEADLEGKSVQRSQRMLIAMRRLGKWTEKVGGRQSSRKGGI